MDHLQALRELIYHTKEYSIHIALIVDFEKSFDFIQNINEALTNKQLKLEPKYLAILQCSQLPNN